MTKSLSSTVKTLTTCSGRSCSYRESRMSESRVARGAMLENNKHHLRIHCQSIPDHACIRRGGVCHPPEAACIQRVSLDLCDSARSRHLTHNWNGFDVSSEIASGAARSNSSSEGRSRGAAVAVHPFDQCTSALQSEAAQRNPDPYLQLQP